MNKKLKTKIYALAFGGAGIGKIDGKVCFVKGALPPEEIVFDVIKDTSRYIEGKAQEILTPSEDRVEPECQYYNICGGCQLQHISYKKELFYKKEQVEQLIQRIAGDKDIKCEDIIASPDCYHYRTSLTVHKGPNGYGFYAEDNVTVIDIEECPIADAAISAELKGLTSGRDRKDITLKVDSEGKVWSSDRSGERFFVDKFRDMDISMSPKAFSQSNKYISEKISETLEDWIGTPAENTAFYDAYCGTGFFSFLLKRDFHLRVGIDSSKTAIACARNTMHNAGISNFKFYEGDVETDFFKVFDRTKQSENILFMDPPRAGVEKSFLQKIKINKDLNKIYYLSCDPAKLARDIKILTTDSDWKLTKVLPFDMFPRTKHIETLAEFVKTC